MTKSAYQITYEARELVRHGWIQNDFINETRTAFCALGAFTQAASDAGVFVDNKTTDNLVVAEETFRSVIGGYSIMFWNDDPERTQQEVVDAFTETLDRLNDK